MSEVTECPEHEGYPHCFHDTGIKTAVCCWCGLVRIPAHGPYKRTAAAT